MTTIPTTTHHETLYRDLSGITDRTILVLGAGALGANVTEHLARMGFSQLRVIDRDRVEAHNLSTQPYSIQEIGMPKVKALAAYLYRAVGTRLGSVVTELTAANANQVLSLSDLVIDCFDNIPSRQVVLDVTRARNIACLHLALGAGGGYGIARWDDRYTLPNTASGVDGCDYPLTRGASAILSAVGAELAVRYLLSGERHDIEVTVGDLRMQRIS